MRIGDQGLVDHSVDTARQYGVDVRHELHIVAVVLGKVGEAVGEGLADGEMLFAAQHGALRLATEFGCIDIEPGEIAVIPRGIRFAVAIDETAAGGGGARGYVAETFDQHFELPPRGVIGANGLANERDFETPVAWYEDREGEMELVAKLGGELWTAALDHSPLARHCAGEPEQSDRILPETL